MTNILIVEDERIVAMELESRLTSLGYSVCAKAVSGEEAVKMTKAYIPDLILMDINIKGQIDGIKTAEEIKRQFDIPLIFLTAFNDTQTIDRAKATEPYGYIIKPFEERELQTNIEIALYKHTMEKKLRISEKRLSIILKSIGDAVIAADNNGVINYINPEAERLTNFSEKQAIGKNIFEIFRIENDIQRNQANEAVQNMNGDDCPTRFPYQVTIECSESTKKIVEVNFNPIKDEKKNLSGMVISFRDISEKLQGEIALLESEKKYRKVVENATEIIFVINTKGEFTFVNDATVKISEYNEDELKEIGYYNLILPAHRSAIKNKVLRQYVSFEKTKTLEYPFRTKSGSIKWLEQKSTLIFEQDKVSGFHIIARDITDKKLAEEKILQLSRAVEQSPVSIIITSVEAKIEYVNPAFTALTGFTLNEIIGKNPRKLIYGSISRQEYRKLWDTIKAGRDWKGEFQNKKKNGEVFWQVITISSVKNSESEITHFLGIIEDITERKRFENELILAKEKAEESNKLKSNFMANMSHELRTPMIGIIGYSDILAEELKNTELREIVEVIKSSSDRLMHTMDLILDLTKIETNRTDVSFKEINIGSVIEREIENYRNTIENKGLYFKIYVKDKNVSSDLDEKLFCQILNNLIGNSVKFTPEGGITVEVDSEKGKNKEWAVIKVIDTGIGIPQNSLSLIFEEFRQVSEGYGRSHEGIGLGLTIIKKSVELMKGEITVESKIGSGSAFTIRFPAVAKKTSEDRNEDMAAKIFELKSVEANRHKILVVDNDKMSRDFIYFILRKYYNMEFAESGQSAIDLASQNKFSAILMDIGLGYGMNGVEATKEIRKIKGYETTPIVAMTAYAMKGDKESFLENGLSHYMSKPFDKNTLLNLLEKILSNSLDKLKTNSQT